MGTTITKKIKQPGMSSYVVGLRLVCRPESVPKPERDPPLKMLPFAGRILEERMA